MLRRRKLLGANTDLRHQTTCGDQVDSRNRVPPLNHFLIGETADRDLLLQLGDLPLQEVK